MKNFSFNYLFTLILTLPGLAVSGQATLSGKVTDKQTGESLPGVNIYLPDLKTGAVSGPDGTYTIQFLPLTKVLVQICA